MQHDRKTLLNFRNKHLLLTVCWKQLCKMCSMKTNRVHSGFLNVDLQYVPQHTLFFSIFISQTLSPLYSFPRGNCLCINRTKHDSSEMQVETHEKS